METILATAFGCAVNVQGGESDELTKAANIIFRSLDEGSATNLHLLIVLSSKFLHRWMSSLYMYTCIVHCFLYHRRVPSLLPHVRACAARGKAIGLSVVCRIAMARGVCAL